MIRPNRSPLAQQLGLIRGQRVWFHSMPEELRRAIDVDSAQVEEQPTATDGLQLALLFASDRERLRRQICATAPLLQEKGAIWIVWRKEDGAGDNSVDAGTVRELAEQAGLFLIDLCPLDDRWAGAKLAPRPLRRAGE